MAQVLLIYHHNHHLVVIIILAIIVGKYSLEVLYVRSIEDNSTISSVAIDDSNYQILRDGNGQIYAIADCLSCTINSDCSDAAKIYFDSGCAAHNSCSSLDILIWSIKVFSTKIFSKNTKIWLY